MVMEADLLFILFLLIARVRERGMVILVNEDM